MSSDFDDFVNVEQSPQGFWFHKSARIAYSATIFPGAYIGPKVRIGEHCVIGPNACIGQPGFGYTTQADGYRAYRPHLMGVSIEDDVHIGANACVDQGRHRKTVIGQGTRIDNLVHVGHNVIIGRNCLIIAHAMLGGSVTIADNSHIAPGALIRDWRNVAEGATVGLGAVVVANVPSGTTVLGNPARTYLKT